MNVSSAAANRALRILCVEDQEILGDVMLCLLAQAGHWVEHVGNGLDAWERISRELDDFDMVITGHLMPDLNGLELVELLREARFPGRVVLYTAGVTNDVAERYRSLGVTSVVQKSSRAEDLLRAIRQESQTLARSLFGSTLDQAGRT